MSITTEAELRKYLKAADIKYNSVEKLSGGTANFVWRLTLPDGETRVLKHAEAFIKDITSIQLPVDRMDFEAEALSVIPDAIGPVSPYASSQNTTVTVRIPTRHTYDSGTHTLILSDGGSSHLKAAYADRKLPVAQIGTALGTWLAALHTRTPNTHIGDNATGKGIYRYAYSHLWTSFKRYDLDQTFAHEINAEFGSHLATDDAHICHGDFWPGNILVSRSTSSIQAEPSETKKASKKTTTTEIDLTVVDWELVRRGLGATDVGQFAGEAYLLDRFCGKKGLLRPFLEAYVSAAKPGLENRKEFVRRAVVHFGVHVAFWPTCVKWCDHEETGLLVRFGREMMEVGKMEDWERLKGEGLEPLLELL